MFPVFRLFLICFSLAFVSPAYAAAAQLLVIDTESGPRAFQVEVARTPEEQERGLMFRNHLAMDAGMLFEFDAPQEVSMWMKNTLIPLDMLFIAEDGRIVSIHERAEPESLSLISSDGPVRAVLELAGGAVKHYGITTGNRVRHAVVP